VVLCHCSVVASSTLASPFRAYPHDVLEGYHSSDLEKVRPVLRLVRRVSPGNGLYCRKPLARIRVSGVFLYESNSDCAGFDTLPLSGSPGSTLKLKGL